MLNSSPHTSCGAKSREIIVCLYNVERLNPFEIASKTLFFVVVVFYLKSNPRFFYGLDPTIKFLSFVPRPLLKLVESPILAEMLEKL